MLPDYPILKQEIEEALTSFLKERIKRYSSLASNMPKTRQFEGGQSAIKRSTGEEEAIDFKCCGANVTIGVDEVAYITIDELLRRIDAAALEMAHGMEKELLKSLDEYLDRHNRTTDAKGSPLSAELLLQALDSMMISFDEQGNAELPTFVIHPDLDASMKRAAKALAEDPRYKEEYDQLIERKREEWIAEQASRKLVG